MHYIEDNELYNLLLEMDNDFHSANATKGSLPSESHIWQSEVRHAREMAATVMTDWEEEMYQMSGQQQDDDAVQEQIMDYYYNQA